MSKLLKLKKWLLLKDAAQYLSAALSEPVKESDILQLALDGHITISIDATQTFYGKRAEVVSSAYAKKTQFSSIKGMPPYELIVSVKAGNDRYLEFQYSGIQSLDGIFDLPMIGGERNLIKDSYQKYTDGISVDLISVDGVFLREPPSEEFGDGGFFQVFNYLEKKENFADLQWYPEWKIQDTVVLVIRTEVLSDFLKNIEVKSSSDRPLEKRERDTLLTIIAALAKVAKIKIDSPGKAAGYIEGLTCELGAPVSKRAIEDHLKKIPDALAPRMK